MKQPKAHQEAIQGGLQGWSVDAPYPYIVVAIDNPTGMPPGLYWYVVDSRKGSTDFKDRVGAASKGELASEYASCHASALYLRHIQGEPVSVANKAYDPYWKRMDDLNPIRL